jgi:hypothetical protein
MKNSLKLELRTLDEADFMHLRHALHIAGIARDLVKDFSLTKFQFCTEINIDQKHYKDFISGGYNYTIKDIAYLEAYKIRLVSAKAAEEEAKNTIINVK